MSSIDPVHDAFRCSYKDFSSYPLNLISSHASPAALEDYYARLTAAKDSLFNDDAAAIRVPFREFDALGRVAVKKITTDATLAEWLSDREKIIVEPDVLDKSHLPLGRNREPKCRFIFFLADHSWNPLNVTKEMFCRILSYHQVNPNYINFCLCFGRQDQRVRDFRFSGFQAQSSLNNPSQSLNIPYRGRSGLQIQLSYKLSAVEPSSGLAVPFSKIKKWARRQIAIHHQFDVIYGTSLWIITSGRNTIQKRIEKLLPDRDSEGGSQEKQFASQADSFKTSLAVHLENCAWSVTEWRWYISWLEEKIETLSQSAIDNDTIDASDEPLRELQFHEDAMNEAIMVLQTNSEVLVSIRSFYEGLLGELSLPWISECREAICQFSSQISDMLYDLKMHMSRGRVLLQISGNRERLLKYRIQAEGNRKIEVLISKMQRATEDSQKEAVAMKIITVITLVYLPATFVSTLFSTDIVRYDGGSQVFSSLALERWVEVTATLTIITLVLAVLWNQWDRVRLMRMDVGKLLSKATRKRRRPKLVPTEWEKGGLEGGNTDPRDIIPISVDGSALQSPYHHRAMG